MSSLREAAKKIIVLMAVPLRGGPGGKKFAIKKKKTFSGIFFFNLMKKFRMPLSSRVGGGGEGLNGIAIKKRLPLIICYLILGY